MKIIPVSFAARDFSDFESVLDLAAPRLSCPWTLGEPGGTGEFYMVSISQPGELEAFLESSPTVEPWRVIVYAAAENKAACHWKIVRRRGSPPRLSELISLLNRIARHLESPGNLALDDIQPEPEKEVAGLEDSLPEDGGGEDAEAGEGRDFSGGDERAADVLDEGELGHAQAGGDSVPGGQDAPPGGLAGEAPGPEEGAVPGFAPMTLEQVRQQDWARFSVYPAGLSSRESFLELLQKDLEGRLDQAHSLGEGYVIVVSPWEGRVYYQSDLLAELLAYRTSLAPVKSRTLIPKRLPEYVGSLGLASAPLVEAVWLAALIDSQSSLLPGASPEVPARLSGVRVLQPLPYFAEFSGLAAVWGARPLSLEQAAAEAGEPLGKAVALYNAAFLLRLFEAPAQAGGGSGEGGAKEAKESSKTGLLEKIGRLLGRGGGG